MKGALQRAGVTRQGDPRQDRARATISSSSSTRLSELAPHEPAHELIRWARNPRLLEAHEQVTYGEAMCWSGDAMRRDADKRNALDLVRRGSSGAVRLGRLAFEALWAASSLVPSGA